MGRTTTCKQALATWSAISDGGRAGLGQMAETIGREPFYQGRKGYEGMLNDVSPHPAGDTALSGSD